MNREELLSGKAGLAGIHSALSGQASRRLLRKEVEAMLQPGYHAGPFQLTRAKFKPGRKLSAYFTFPVFDAAGKACPPMHIAVTWENSLDGDQHTEARTQLQEEADR